MSDEATSNGKGGGAGVGDDDGGRVRKLPTLSRSERLALADVLVHWASATGAMRDVVDEWAKCIDDLRRLGEALDELELDRRIAQGLLIVRQMRTTEEMSETTRKYLRNVLGIAATVEFDE